MESHHLHHVIQQGLGNGALFMPEALAGIRTDEVETFCVISDSSRDLGEGVLSEMRSAKEGL